MRKLMCSLNKNLKLLFRNKETVYTIIFGPLLIILLVGFAFMGGDSYAMKVGVSGNHSLRTDTVTLLQHKGYIVVPYNSADDCQGSVKDGTAHACIDFSPETITIYLDESRMNLVYKISEDLSSVMNIQSNSLRQALATDAISRINTAKASVDDDLKVIEMMKAHQAAAKGNLTLARSSLNKIGNTTFNISLSGVSGYQLGLMQDVRTAVNISVDALSDSSSMIHKLEMDCSDCSNKTLEDARNLEFKLDDLSNNLTLIANDRAKAKLDHAKYVLDTAISDIDNLNSRMMNESAARNNILSATRLAADDIDNDSVNLARLDSSLHATRNVLDGTKANASMIASPVDISVVSVAGENTKSTFTYPYLFVLVVMFMGLLLASTLVVTEKTSRASFRTFTTPTSDLFHVISSFITAFIILSIEAIIILGISMLFISEPLLILTPTTMLIVALSIVVFAFIGMIIGFLVKSQESAMITSISVGSVLLFVSNVIAPIEGMASIVQVVSSINPYLVLSELLKRSMLFGMPMSDVFGDLMVIFALVALLFVIMLIVNNRSKKRYFKQDGGILAPHVPAPLELNGHYIHNAVDLLDALDHMNRVEFESIVKNDDNVISLWAKKELRSSSLSKKLRTTSKERMMLQLEDYLKKHGKQMK